MPPTPLSYAAARAPTSQWLASRFSRVHGWIALLLWLGFSAITFWGVLHGLTEPTRVRRAMFTAACTAMGPVTGAVSRNFQSCCVAVSLQLLPYCLAALIIAAAVQLTIPPVGAASRWFRVIVWTAGLLIWFGGGVASLLHALS